MLFEPIQLMVIEYIGIHVLLIFLATWVYIVHTETIGNNEEIRYLKQRVNLLEDIEIEEMAEGTEK